MMIVRVPMVAIGYRLVVLSHTKRCAKIALRQTHPHDPTNGFRTTGWVQLRDFVCLEVIRIFFSVDMPNNSLQEFSHREIFFLLSCKRIGPKLSLSISLDSPWKIPAGIWWSRILGANPKNARGINYFSYGVVTNAVSLLTSLTVSFTIEGWYDGGVGLRGCKMPLLSRW